MTPDVQAAATRIGEYLQARRVMNAILRQEDTGTLDSCRNVPLYLSDVLALLAAADPAEAPIDHDATETRIEWATRQRWPSDGAEQITDPVGEWLARRRVTQYPKMHKALMHRHVRYGPWIEGEPETGETGGRAETGQRHAPLTDDPCGIAEVTDEDRAARRAGGPT